MPSSQTSPVCHDFTRCIYAADSFAAEDLVLVRVATSDYGMHLLSKVRLPESPRDVYFHFRAFVAGDTVKLHSIQTEERELPDGTKQFRAIFSQTDPLQWFDA
jgi:hypothetical protein